MPQDALARGDGGGADFGRKWGPDQDPGGVDQYLLAGEVWILVE